MECFLCLNEVEEKVHCLQIKSTAWDEMEVANIICKHLWPTILLKPKTQFLCSKCWDLLHEFHYFYVELEKGHLNQECLIKTELNTVRQVEQHYSKELGEALETENVLQQSIMSCVKEEFEILDVNDDVPLIHVKTSANKSAMEHIGDCTSASVVTKIVTTEKNATSQDDLIHENQDNNDNIINEKGNTGKPPKDKNIKCFKYFYQSSLHCRDYDKFIAKHFTFSCTTCEQSFALFSQLKSHSEEAHKKRGFAMCCDTEFFNRGLLVDHICCHLNPKYFQCEFCPKVLKTRQTFRTHMRSHDSHCCDVCNKKFTRKCYLKFHKQSHNILEDGKKISCNECSKLFASEFLLANHMKLVHFEKGKRKTLPEPKKALADPKIKFDFNVSCNVCDLVMSSKNNLRKHMKERHSAEETQGYVNKMSLTPDGLSHRIRRNYLTGFIHKCNVCEKVFKRFDHLKAHANVHATANEISNFPKRSQEKDKSEIKIMSCGDCNKIFASEFLLSTHQKRMHPSKTSETCGEAQQSLKALKRQLQKHDSKVSCMICGLIVTNKYYLQVHMNLKHQHDGYKQRMCPICHKVSLTAEALRHHIRRNHPSGEIHECTMCERTFKRLDHFKSHMKNHSDKNLFRCDFCPMAFKSSGALTYHRRTVHPIEWENAREYRYSGNEAPVADSGNSKLKNQ